MPRTGPAALALALLSSGAAHAAPPEILIVGGGWGPEGTQASIEAHVEALQASLQPRTVEVLFAAGSGPAPAVQVPREAPDPVGALLGLVFDRRDGLGVRYRKTRLTRAGRASRAGFLKAVLQHRRRGDTIVFAAGHGAPAEGDAPAALELWGPDDRLTVPELADALDETPGRRLALVLGQCHSGAFTDVAFVGADPDIGLAAPTRCVLAAVPASREASGCTPDVDDPGARAYLAVIAEALAAPDRADRDGDGAVSLAEAHAYALVHDGTVDLPVRSSEAWLARRLGRRAPDLARLSRDALEAAAAPEDRYALQSILPKAYARAAPGVVRAQLARLDRANEALDRAIAAVADRREVARRKLVDAVLLRWPVLANPYHAEARALLAGDAPEVMRYVRARPELEALLSLDRSLAALDAQLLARLRETVRFERWLRVAQRVADEAALRATKSTAKIEALDALLACERMVPGGPK